MNSNRQAQTNQPQRSGLYIFSLFISFAVLVVVMMAIDRGFFWPLIIGSVITLAIVIIAGASIVSKIAIPFMDTRLKYLDARLEQERALWKHERETLKLQLAYTPALEEPEGGSLIDSEVEQWKPQALQLIGVTYEKMGIQSRQLMPFNKCATDRIEPFYDVDVWQGAVSWLFNHGHVTKQMKGDKCIGYYFSNGRTVADIYKRLIGDN